MCAWFFRGIGLATAVLITGCSPAMPAAAEPPGPAVAAADAFVDAIGVDAHFNYRDSPYVLLWPTIRDVLIDSGIRHIRDGGKPESDYLQRLAELGRHGIHHGVGFSIEATPDLIKERLAAYAPYVDNVEPPNEFDSRQDIDPNWAEKLVAFQRMLYTTVRSDSRNASIQVLGPPLEHQKLYADLGSLDAIEDAANLHIATCDRNPGTTESRKGSIAYMHSLIRSSTPTKPIWTTETGYNDDMSRPCALADDYIARYDPRTVAEKWNAGEQRIYFYQLADMPTDRIFGGMGLIRADGSPKPQFLALKSMVAFLADPGPKFTPSMLQFKLSGDTRSVHTTLLEKRNGDYELLLWIEVRSWDPLFRRPIDVAPQDVTVSFPQTVVSAGLHTYASNWTLVASPVHIENEEVHIQVTDAISFLELTSKH